MNSVILKMGSVKTQNILRQCAKCEIIQIPHPHSNTYQSQNFPVGRWSELQIMFMLLVCTCTTLAGEKKCSSQPLVELVLH